MILIDKGNKFEYGMYSNNNNNLDTNITNLCDGVNSLSSECEELTFNVSDQILTIDLNNNIELYKIRLLRDELYNNGILDGEFYHLSLSLKQDTTSKFNKI